MEDPAQQSIDQATPASNDSKPPTAATQAQAASGARERAAHAKQQELAAHARAVTPLADWRRVTADRPVDRVPAHLRDKIAATAERVAATFQLSA